MFVDARVYNRVRVCVGTAGAGQEAVKSRFRSVRKQQGTNTSAQQYKGTKRQRRSSFSGQLLLNKKDVLEPKLC